MSLLQADRVDKHYVQGDQTIAALTDLSLSIDSREFVLITGASGSGKSTLLSLLGALDHPTHGSIRFMDRPVSGESPASLAQLRRQYIGFVFQDFRLVRHLSAVDNVRLPLLFSSGSDGKDEADRLLTRVRMQHRSQHRPDDLSRGEMQRVAIARALVNRPTILIADEPTANLDRRNSEVIWGLLEELNRQDEVTVIVATHNVELKRHAGRVVHLDDGRIVSDEVV